MVSIERGAPDTARHQNTSKHHPILAVSCAARFNYIILIYDQVSPDSSGLRRLRRLRRWRWPGEDYKLVGGSCEAQAVLVQHGPGNMGVPSFSARELGKWQGNLLMEMEKERVYTRLDNLGNLRTGYKSG